jgi:4-amino-4-deoxy-L-arabinose transferase-like glycosyltransferase
MNRFLATFLVLVLATVLRVWGISYYPFKDECQLALTTLLMDARGTLDPPVSNWPPLLYYLNIGLLELCQLVGVLPDTEALLLQFVKTAHLEVGPLHFVLRGLAVAIGVATVWLTLWAGRLWLGEVAGLLAAVLLSVSYLHVVYSHIPVTDGLTALCVFGAVALAGEALRRRNRRWLVAAVFVSGLAVGAKYFGGLAAVAALGALWRLDRSEGRSMAQTLRSVALLGLPLLAGIWLAIPGLPFHPAGYLSWLNRHRTDMGAGWEGFEHCEPGWIYHLTTTLRWGLSGLHVEILAGAGLWFLARRHGLGFVVLPFLLVWWLVVGATRVQFARYWVPVLPPLCLAAAAALHAIAERLPARVRGPGFLGLAVLVLAWPAWQVVRYDQQLAAGDTRREAREWLEAHLPAGSAIASLYPLWVDPPVVAALQRQLDPAGLRALLEANAWDQLAKCLSDTAYPFVDPFLYPTLSAASTGEPGVPRDLPALRQAGARYFLWSSFKERVFEEAGSAHAERQRFLARVQQEAELLATFPAGVDSSPPLRAPWVELETHGVWSLTAERAGPLIEIYRLK